MGGGLTDYHRQKRKKEQKKNKEKRLAERDARVLETKTASSVQEEIRKLERQHKVKKDDDGNEIPLPHAVKSKLDRLKKELKILKEAEGEKKDNNLQGNKSAAAAAQAAWKPLDNPQLSIYYDPVMNPFGEPPPGQPRLYHTADGRTTFNLADAALPGSRPHPPPSPRKDPPSQQKWPPPHRPQQQQRSVPRKEERPPVKLEPNQKGNNERSATKEKPARELEGASQAPTAKAPTPEQRPRVAPDLPAPSQAVKRGRSRLKADIWASIEEIDYHQHADDPQAHLTLEGVEAAAGGKDGSVKEWWYEDQQKQTQGPFPHEQMIAWIQAGYFPAETRAKSGPDAAWKPFHHYPVIRAVLNGSKGKVTQKEEKEMSIQDRIASLRKEHKNISIADRIAALRGDRPKPDIKEPDASQDNGEDEEVALPPPPPPPEEGEGAREMPAYPVADDTCEVVEDDALPPPPPPAPLEGGPTVEPPPYAIDETEHDALPLPPPPPPAYGGSGEQDQIPAYTIGDAPAYEETADYPPAYPTEDYYGDAAYSVDDAPVTDAYPVLDAYPTMDSLDTDVTPPVKKKAKVDREVISFLPTNLQKRKKKS